MTHDRTHADDSGHEYREPDHSFGMAVVHELAERGEWGAIHATSDHATASGGGALGPVAVARELDVPADPHDQGAVEMVVEAVLDFWDVHVEERRSYGESIDYGPNGESQGRQD